MSRVDVGQVTNMNDIEALEERVTSVENNLDSEIDTREEQFTELKNEATKIQHLPFLGIDFTVESGKQHSSATDQLAVSIAQGAEYSVALSSGLLYAYYSDSTSTNVPLTGTAAKDIVAFGVYLNNTSGESPVTVSLRVASNPMGADIYNKSVKAIDMAKGSPFVGTQFNVAAGAEHSSVKDHLLVNIKAGDAYRVSKTTGVLYAYYSDGTVASVASFGTASKDIIAFGVYYDNRSGSDPVTISLKAASNPIGADIFDAAGVIPEYYKDHLASAESRIRANMMEVGKDGETFIFITDLHWKGNAKTSPSLVKHVMSKLNINLLLCGGDIIDEGEKDVMASQMVDAIKAFSPTENIVMPCLFGNHDGNWNDYNNQRQYPERRFTLSDQYALMQKQAENLVTYITDDKWNFYFDVKNTGTRIIGLDTGEYDTGEAQGEFTNYQNLSDCLMQTPSGYHIVILAHWLYQNGKTTSCEKLESLIDAYNSADAVTIDGTTYSFANASGKIMLMMGGHLHDDMDWTTPNGVPVVLTDCDTYAATHSDAPHSRGTIGEQAFDVVTINYDDNAEKTVKIVRIGRGEDRSFPVE